MEAPTVPRRRYLNAAIGPFPSPQAMRPYPEMAVIYIKTYKLKASPVEAMPKSPSARNASME